MSCKIIEKWTTISAQDESDNIMADFFSQLGEPFTGELVFDGFADVVFFIKNGQGEYVVVNQTLVKRCGLKQKAELIGKRADDVFPAPLGQMYRTQDELVLKSGQAILNQLELHFYTLGGRGWCLTNKFPLRNRHGVVIGLAGISRDLQAPNERGRDYTQVAQAIRHIQTNYGEELRVKEIAASVGLSEYQFEQRLRKIFQLTAGQIIQKTRMDAAIVRLRDTDDSIAAVAAHCGYSDQSAFTRQFRQSTGMAPSEYRKGLREAGAK
jgi:AraC-like DNA-binding protein